MPQDLNVNESPPTWGSCDPPISTMSSPSIGDEKSTFTVTNRSSSPTTDYVIFVVVADEQRRQFWVAVDVQPRSTASYTATYSANVDISEIRHCKQRPWTISESGEPVLAVTENEPTQ